MNPIISIITVTMNHLPLLKKMLSSLYIDNPPKVNFELILVDNCSTDNTEEFIRAHYPQIRYYKNAKIAGFAANNNKAASYAKGEYILILNPDIILLKDSIDTLYQYLQTHQEVGIVAPQLLNTDLSVQHSARTFISPRILMARIFTKGKDDSTNQHVKQYLMTELSQTDPSEVDWCMGAALLLRNPFYKQLKGFDEGFFLYVEDMDICHRCWNLGKKVIYLPSSKMIHAHQRSSQKINRKTFLHLKSMLYFFRKNRFKINR